MTKCTKADVAELISEIYLMFPNHKIENQDDARIVELWYMVLEDLTKEQLVSAFKSYIKSGNAYAPNAGQIYQLAIKTQNIVSGSQLTEAEAWAKVRKAISNGYYGAEKEWNELPDICKKAVGDASNLRAWAQCDLEGLETVVKSHFARAYRQALEENAFVGTLEADTRTLIPKSDNFIAIEEKKAYEPSQSGVPAPEGFMDLARAIIGA